MHQYDFCESSCCQFFLNIVTTNAMLMLLDSSHLYEITYETMYHIRDYVVCLFDFVSDYVSFSCAILSWIMHGTYYVVKIFDNINAGIIVFSIFLRVQKHYNAQSPLVSNIIWHSTSISSLGFQYLIHPNRNIGISFQYQCPRYWTFSPIQYLASQYKTSKRSIRYFIGF
jgi:hypothetical protein